MVDEHYSDVGSLIGLATRASGAGNGNSNKTFFFLRPAILYGFTRGDPFAAKSEFEMRWVMMDFVESVSESPRPSHDARQVFRSYKQRAETSKRGDPEQEREFLTFPLDAKDMRTGN